MNDQDRMTETRSRLAALRARVDNLGRLPARLRRQIQESEQAGDVEEADKAEEQLASLIGPAEAAQFRSSVLEQLCDAAEREASRRMAEQSPEYPAALPDSGELIMFVS